MSLAHAQGLRDALLKLRDTYSPPTADEVQLFSSTISTNPDEDRQPPKPLHLRADLPVPLPDFKPKPSPLANPAQSTQQLLSKRKLALDKPVLDYPAEPVETRW